MLLVNVLKIRTLVFDSAHYIKGHPKCGSVHGHTYTVENLRVETTKFVDFEKLKIVIEEIDHLLLVPREDDVVWERVCGILADYNIGLKILYIDGPTIVENIKKELCKLFLGLPGVQKVSFDLYEGLNSGVAVSERVRDIGRS